MGSCPSVQGCDKHHSFHSLRLGASCFSKVLDDILFRFSFKRFALHLKILLKCQKSIFETRQTDMHSHAWHDSQGCFLNLYSKAFTVCLWTCISVYPYKGHFKNDISQILTANDVMLLYVFFRNSGKSSSNYSYSSNIGEYLVIVGCLVCFYCLQRPWNGIKGVKCVGVSVCVDVYLYLWQKLWVMDIFQVSVDSAILWLVPLVSLQNHKAPQI